MGDDYILHIVHYIERKNIMTLIAPVAGDFAG